MGPDEAWSQLRQGARNVAGVSWQIEVTTYLLVMGRIGLLKFRHFTPEGIEDVDCRDADGLVTYVQMKELAAGNGRMAASRLADAVFHAHQYAAGRPVAVVTDGELGSGLTFAGWGVDMQTHASPGVKEVAKHLVSAGISEEVAAGLLGKTFLVRLPWDLRPLTEKLLVDSLGVPPAVSGFAVSRMYDLVAAASADQRATTAQSAKTITAGDVDSVLVEVQSTVGLDCLDEAVSAGVCVPASYVTTSKLTKDQFFLGAEGAPGLIGAGLDVVRSMEMQAILDGFTSHRYAFLLGPSGAGKSVLLWRAARDVLLGASVLRVLRVSTPDEVELLVRHVTLQRPSQTAPIVVAVDNLGRPHVSAWPDAVHRLREIPWVYLLGAARSEDFSPRLVSGGATMIELTLDAATADDVARAVRDSGIELSMDPDEARDRAQGLLMEYLALLTAGKRFRDVIAEQVEGLRDPNRRVERTLARWVTAAHALGLGLEAEALPRLLEEHDDIVGDALGRLRGEHVILQSHTEWRGLHELRSATISELLHESPPPTLTQTLSQVAEAVSLPLAGWFLRRVAQEAPQAVSSVARRIGGRLASVEDALVVASILEGAERADSVIYGAQSLPVLREQANAKLSVHDIALFTYGIGNHGLFADPIGISEFDKTMQRMSQIAVSIGPRPAKVAEAVGKTITGHELLRLASGEKPELVARLLEACLDVVHITEAEALAIYAGLSTPNNPDEADIHARIIDSLAVLAGLNRAQVSSCFGDVDSRANMLTCTEPWALNVSVGQSGDGTMVTATVLCPDSAPDRSASLAWDSGRRDPDDLVHGQAMRIAQRLADGCPEADVVEIRTLSPSGLPYVIADHEPGYKRLKREVFKRRESVRRAVSYQAAVRRLDASSSWTDLVREQVRISNELTRLLEESHNRLAVTDNAARRLEWTSSVAEVGRTIKALKARPVAVAVDPGLSHAQTDQDERSHDPVSRAFELIAGVLEDLPGQRIPTGIALTIQKAHAAVEEAQREGLPTLGSLGSPLPPTLTVALLRLLNLQRAVAVSPAAARLIRASPESVDQAVSLAVEETRVRESDLLKEVLSGPYDYRPIRVLSSDPAANSVDGCDIVVMADLSVLDDLAVDLQNAKRELRDGLTARVYVVATYEDKALPLAFQLTTHLAADLLPVPLETRISLFDAAGLIPQSAALAEDVAGLLQELAGRSYAAALRQMRNGAWPATPPKDDIDPAEYLTPDIPVDHPIVDHLVDLCTQVMAEEEGRLPAGQLASVLYQTLSGEQPDADQARLLHAVSMASILSLL
ncbi:hypothetical protein [Arthrobacter sp. 131MFCol6.1]|uniref:hypothetical protein n=1 Tax=Arthrobacter sp. 131MFCol6.1 TaxID=1157944 RepID=UPI0012DF4A85|nr:hypothetical protein [Arthrobacter sp. 131MFCol6.1]